MSNVEGRQGWGRHGRGLQAMGLLRMGHGALRDHTDLLHCMQPQRKLK